jgi:hypothetical protein
MRGWRERRKLIAQINNFLRTFCGQKVKGPRQMKSIHCKCLAITMTILQCLKLAVSKRPNRGAFLPSHENGNRSCFQNALFSSFWNTGQWTKSNPVIWRIITAACTKVRIPNWQASNGTTFSPNIVKICQLIQKFNGCECTLRILMLASSGSTSSMNTRIHIQYY